MKKPIFHIKNLSYVKNNNTILNIKNFEIHRGACYMISGNMASGKTLFIETLSKNIKNYKGDIIYDGKSLSSYSYRKYYNDIAIVKQVAKRPFFKDVKGYIQGEISKRHNDTTANKKFENIVTNMDLKYLLNKKVRDLTPSQFRWVNLASKIASYPKVLFIDELELHLNKRNIDSLSKILYRKCNYDGVTIIASTMHPEFFNNLISVSINLKQGRITKLRSFSNKFKKRK
tara:strand:+ start:307 stop:996 length:690 start_codon:yes stop_codon:yes gene_type:complete